MKRTSGWLALLLLLATGGAGATDPPASAEPEAATEGFPGMGPDGRLAPELVERLEGLLTGSDSDLPLPMGVWLRAGNAHLFSYVDHQAGPSVAGEMPFGMDEEGTLTAHVITRTHTIGGMTLLTDAERNAAGLPIEPDWLRGYGPQPPRGSLWGVWRTDPKLIGRFHPDYPDDLQVWIYKGTRERMRGRPELVWVRLWSCTPEVCEGEMLNEPFHIKSLHEGDMIRFGKDPEPGGFLVMQPRAG